jgi:hypothetical protein
MTPKIVPIVPPREKGGTERLQRVGLGHPPLQVIVPKAQIENTWPRNGLGDDRSVRSTKSFHGTVVWNGWGTTVPQVERPDDPEDDDLGGLE